MTKKRWLLIMATLLVVVSMSAQFPGGFGNFGQMAQRQAAQKAAEEATRQAEQQPDSSTIANGTESPDALAVLQMGPTTGSPCWVPRNGGTKYHSKSSCSQMVDPIYTTVDTAAACGFEACKKCH